MFKRLKYKLEVWKRKRILHRMIRKAMDLHKLTGKRYYIIPTDNDKLLIVDNGWVNEYNRKIKNRGQILTIERLLKMSFFVTPLEGITRDINNKSKKNINETRQKKNNEHLLN